MEFYRFNVALITGYKIKCKIVINYDTVILYSNK
jgi:hypothetical protein